MDERMLAKGLQDVCDAIRYQNYLTIIKSLWSHNKISSEEYTECLVSTLKAMKFKVPELIKED